MYINTYIYIYVFDFFVYRYMSRLSQTDFIFTIMRRGLAYCFCLPSAFRYKKPAPCMSRTAFYVRGHRLLKCVMLIGGVSQPKVRTFCNSEWPDSGKFRGSIACLHSTTLCPYAPKTDKK